LPWLFWWFKSGANAAASPLHHETLDTSGPALAEPAPLWLHLVASWARNVANCAARPPCLFFGRFSHAWPGRSCFGVTITATDPGRNRSEDNLLAAYVCAELDSPRPGPSTPPQR